MTVSTADTDLRPGGALELHGVSGGYGGREVVRDLDLRVEAGESLAVLGASGSGKTTVLRMIAGLHPLSSGRILLDGRRVDTLPAQRRGVGLVPQQGALFPHLDVAHNVGFGLVPADPLARWRGRSDRAARIREVLELVGLADRARDKPSQLSGGQQQRVALARALAPGAGLILLDEPFSALDAALRGRVRAEVAALLAESGATSILVTHDRSEALATADRVAVLIDGLLAQVDTPERLYQYPTSREVAQLSGEVVLLPARADGEVAHTVVGRVPLDSPAHGEGTVLWRPESLALQRVEDAERAAGDGHGVCTGVEFGGASTLVRMSFDGTSPGDTTQSCAVPVHSGGAFSVGDRVAVRPLRPAVFHAAQAAAADA